MCACLVVVDCFRGHPERVGKVFQDFLASLLTKFYHSRNYYVMRNHDPAEEYLTVAQFAAEVGRPVSTVHNWITTGRIAATKIGDGRTSAYVIPRIEVDAWLDGEKCEHQRETQHP